MGDRLVIQGGLVIDTAPAVTVRPGTDVLVESGRIVAVGPGLAVSGAEVLDATDRIVLPGFVDTHRHVWQPALRGIAADASLGWYLSHVLGTYGPRFRPEDVAASNLVGALEALDSGVTTIQDYSHLHRDTESADAALDGLAASGIRAVFGFGCSPLTGGAVDRAGMRHVVSRRASLITPALAAVGPSYAPLEVVRSDWDLAAELGLPIVVHVGEGPGGLLPIELLRDEKLLRTGTVYVHGNSLPDSELHLIADSGGSVAITPFVEARMEMGPPMATRLAAAGVQTGLGADTVTNAPGDLFTAMRMVLSLGYQSFTAADALRLATIDGARTLGLADRVGSLQPGKEADLILLRATDLNLVGGLSDPVGTVVTSAHPGNVDTVLVAGRVVKRAGQLVSADPAAAVSALKRSSEYLAAP